MIEENNLQEGLCEGETCNRNGCKGIIQQYRDPNQCCSCHINPPCSYCHNDDQYCDDCGWDNNEEMGNTPIFIQPDKFPVKEIKPPIYDPRPIYEVQRFFDDIYEVTVKSNLSEKEAREYARKCATAKERYYVSFAVRKMKFTFLEWLQKIA